VTQLLVSPPLFLGIARCRKAEARAVTLPTLAVGKGVGASPLSRSAGGRQAEGCGKAEAGPLTLPTLAMGRG